MSSISAMACSISTALVERPLFERVNVQNIPEVTRRTLSLIPIHGFHENAHIHEEPFSRLEFLAEVCSSSNIHWDDRQKHHYLDCMNEVELPTHFICSGLQYQGNSTRMASEAELQTGTPPLNVEASAYEGHVPSSPTLPSLSSPATGHIDLPSTPFGSSPTPPSPTKMVDAFLGSTCLKDDLYDLRPLIVKPVLSRVHHDLERSPVLISKSYRDHLRIVSSSPLVDPISAQSAIDPSLSPLFPLSSLISSPLNSTSDNTFPPHYSLSSSPPSSPFPDSYDPNPFLSMEPPNIRATPLHRVANSLATLSQIKHRSVTSSPEPATRKKHRGAPPSPVFRPIGSSSISTKSTTWSVNAKRKTCFAKRPCRSRKHSSIQSRGIKRPDNIADKENLHNGPSGEKKPLKINTENLPMSGFLVETLALSRASAMTASELLRAVLKSQPHLKEELSENEWLIIVKEILHKVEVFGRIERNGLDAADCPLEDQWFYIPENDSEPGRADLLKGLMPVKRTVTKQSKQYYFRPITKLTRWDSDDD